jgi:hypothetical protein
VNETNFIFRNDALLTQLSSSPKAVVQPKVVASGLTVLGGYPIYQSIYFCFPVPYWSGHSFLCAIWSPLSIPNLDITLGGNDGGSGCASILEFDFSPFGSLHLFLYNPVHDDCGCEFLAGSEYIDVSITADDFSAAYECDVYFETLLPIAKYPQADILFLWDELSSAVDWVHVVPLPDAYVPESASWKCYLNGPHALVDGTIYHQYNVQCMVTTGEPSTEYTMEILQAQICDLHHTCQLLEVVYDQGDLTFDPPILSQEMVLLFVSGSTDVWETILPDNVYILKLKVGIDSFRNECNPGDCGPEDSQSSTGNCYCDCLCLTFGDCCENFDPVCDGLFCTPSTTSTTSTPSTLSTGAPKRPSRVDTFRSKATTSTLIDLEYIVEVVDEESTLIQASSTDTTSPNSAASQTMDVLLGASLAAVPLMA